MVEPRELVDRLEQGAELPSSNEERFAGYGVMGVPFTSGDLLATRRFPPSSPGQGYTSVWHRDSQGRGTFYSDVPPQLVCPRYFGSAVDEAVVGEIEITWSSPQDSTVSIKEDFGLDWYLSLAEPLARKPRVYRS